MSKVWPKRPAEFIKKCKICGATSAGYCYQVLCCNPCKFFFYRNAHNDKLKCKKGEQCEIVPSQRRICSACRLKKCLQIGMNKDNTNRNQLERIFKNSTELKSGEYCFLGYVQSAASYFPEEADLASAGEAQSWIEFLNLPQYAVKFVIKFCKSFAAFTGLSEQDQYNLLKQFYPYKGPVCVSYSYNMRKKGFLLVNKTCQSVFVPTTILRGCKSFDLYLIVDKFIKSLHREMENDKTIRNLILTQLLFSPKRNVQFPESIRYQHILHHYLLSRYLEHKYGDIGRASAKYDSLMKLMDQIDFVTDKIKQSYTTVQSNELDQVLVEIFC